MSRRIYSSPRGSNGAASEDRLAIADHWLGRVHRTVRHGSPEQFFATQVTSAKRQGLGMVAGVNLLNGGCGPAERKRFLPGIPGTVLAGTQAGDYQMSAEELVYYKTVAMTNPYVCASVDWSWGPNLRAISTSGRKYRMRRRW